jgi:hypothetical protein
MFKIIKNRRFWIYTSFLYFIALFLLVIVKIYSPTGSLHFTRELILENRAKGYWNLNLVPFKSIKSYFEFHILRDRNSIIYGNNTFGSED